MPSLHSPFFSLRGACLTMRGGSGPLCTPRSKSSDLASAPIRGRSAPPTPGVYAGLAAPAPTCRRSALHPGDFLPDEKVTKESPRGGHPLWVLPLGGIIIPPAAQALLPPRKGFRHNKRPICHFELSEQISLVFSSGFIEGTLCVFNPWRGRFLTPEDA